MTSRFRRKPFPNPLKIGKLTIFQFASNTSIHGIAYVFDKNIQKCDRLLWLILVCFGAGIAIHMSHQAWTNWKSRLCIPIRFADMTFKKSALARFLESLFLLL